MREPEVVTGYRGPRNEREAQRGTGAVQERVIPEGKTLIQFTATKYRLQLTSYEERKRSDGSSYSPKSLFVVADQGFKLLDNKKDAEIIARLKGGTFTGITHDGQEVKDLEFERHPFYGRDFWDFADVLEKAERDRESEAAKVLADPKARARIMKLLRESGEEAFELPSEDKSGQGDAQKGV